VYLAYVPPDSYSARWRRKPITFLSQHASASEYRVTPILSLQLAIVLLAQLHTQNEYRIYVIYIAPVLDLFDLIRERIYLNYLSLGFVNSQVIFEVHLYFNFLFLMLKWI